MWHTVRGLGEAAEGADRAWGHAYCLQASGHDVDVAFRGRGFGPLGSRIALVLPCDVLGVHIRKAFYLGVTVRVRRRRRRRVRRRARHRNTGCQQLDFDL